MTEVDKRSSPKKKVILISVESYLPTMFPFFFVKVVTNKWSGNTGLTTFHPVFVQTTVDLTGLRSLSILREYFYIYFVSLSSLTNLGISIPVPSLSLVVNGTER